MRNLSSKAIRTHRAALARFNDVYTTYLDEQPNDPAEWRRSRENVALEIPAAQRAMDLVGTPIAMTPTPMPGEPIVRGLANVAFVHEVYPGNDTRFIRDQIIGALASLDDLERAASRRRFH